MKGSPDPAGTIISTSTDQVLVEVKSNQYAIGYDSLGFVTDEVKKLKVDGVAPTIENIKSGAYKISRPLNVVYQEATLDNELYKAFFDFIQSKKAQEIIKANGYVSTNDNAKDYTVKSGIKGSVKISGSTSLQPLMTILAEEFEKIQADVKIEVAGGGSGTGYKNAKEGASNFGMISEVFNQSKADNCVHYEVAKDGIAIIVNLKNTFDNITSEQLKNIYDGNAGDKAIKVWSKING